MTPLPRIHADYTELDNCPCVLCVNYREATGLYLESIKAMEQVNHTIRCSCEVCKKHRRLLRSQTIADAKRTLWSESVFTAEGHSWGPLFMDYMEKQIFDEKYTAYFWTQDVETLSMDHWIESFIEEVGESEIRISASRMHSEDILVKQALFTEPEGCINVEEPGVEYPV